MPGAEPSLKGVDSGKESVVATAMPTRLDICTWH